MPRLICSPAALLDLQRLYRFLAEKNIDATKRAVQAIREGMKVIARQPGIGRHAKDIDAEFRDWLIDFWHFGYVVLYRYEGQEALILDVRHQREMGD